MKKVVGGLLMLTLLVGMKNAEASCRWHLNQETQKFECLNSELQDEGRQLDEVAKREGKLPEEHEKCQGKRTLSMDGGVASFGCEG